MAPVTARAAVLRPGTGNSLLRSGGAVLAALLLLSFVFVALPRTGIAQQGAAMGDTGIRYPDGFDLNTVGEVQGRAGKLTVPERGPVRFQLSNGADTYTVLAAPAWYWRELGISLAEGQEVFLQGSKSLGADGTLYVIAQVIRLLPSGRTLVFRDHLGRPVWGGRGQPAR